MVNGAIIGLGLVGWFAALALAELVTARRGRRIERSSDARLVTNFGLGALVLGLNSFAPLAKVGSSVVAQSLWPVNAWPWPITLVALLLVDSLTGYWAHRLMHAVPLFWRVHRVHHADPVVDVSTSLRHHPLELLITIPASAAAILLIGAPPSAVVVAQTIVFASAIWQHADLGLPRRVDRALAQIIVTPAFHRLHHSPNRRLHDGNYGDVITLWDRLFGTAKFSDQRLPVGLQGQSAPSEGLIAQLMWPVRVASAGRSLDIKSL